MISSRIQDQRLEKTHESERKDRHSRNGMREHSDTEDMDVSRTHVQVPQEIPQRKALQQSGNAIVAPDSLFPIVRVTPGLALLIEEDDIQTQGVDEAALHERDDVHIPADPSAGVEVSVGLRTEVVRDEGRNDVGDEDVEAKSKEDLVGVQGKCWQAASVGEVLDGGAQGCGRPDGVRVEHGESLPGGGAGQRMRRMGMDWDAVELMIPWQPTGKVTSRGQREKVTKENCAPRVVLLDTCHSWWVGLGPLRPALQGLSPSLSTRLARLSYPPEWLSVKRLQ